jgi:hypothetical protein
MASGICHKLDFELVWICELIYILKFKLELQMWEDHFSPSYELSKNLINNVDDH